MKLTQGVRAVLGLALATVLWAADGGEDGGPSPLEVGVGGFTQRFSEGSDPWQGWLLDVAFGTTDRSWQLSVVGHDRPEGKGTFVWLSKTFDFGEASWIALGAGAGTGAAYLPQGRFEMELHLEASQGLGFGFLGALGRFQDGLEVRTLQAGPSWTGSDWSVSARFQRLDYEPDGGYDQGYLLDIRKEVGERGAWHSLRLGYGHGILESLQGSAGVTGPTGSWGGASYGGFGSGGWNRGPGSSQGGGPRGAGPRLAPLRETGAISLQALAGTLVDEGPLPKERMVTLLSNWPLRAGMFLRTEVSWGDREGLYHTLGGTVQVIVRFPRP